MRILELHLLANDLSRTAEFYVDRMGFALLHQDQHLLTIASGESLLHFRPANRRPAQYHFAFEVPNNKFNDAFDWFSERTKLVPVSPGILVADFVNWKAKSFYFFDTQGNILECIARFEANTHSKEKFSSRSINYISEIGIVTNDLPHTIHQLKVDFNITSYSRQAPQQDFAAIGDDEGLFILAANQRPWYPTDILASKCLTRIIFEQNGHAFEWTIE